MNCQECRDLFEDMLDRRVDESLRKRMDIHLFRCCDCRSELERQRTAHTKVFRALNSANGALRLPEGFADRLVAECRRRPLPWWRRVASLPRWALVAASLAVMAGFVFASVVAVDTFVGALPPDGDGDEAWGEEVVEAEYAEPCASAPFSAAGCGQSESSINGTTTTKGAKTMKIRKTMIRALASAALVTTVPATATELPWTAGAADLGGKIAITYDAVETGKVKTLVATPADGETLTVTGDAMTFAAGATISMAADGKLIFANDVASDGALSLDRTDGAYCDWTATKDGALSQGYCLRKTSQEIFKNKSLADWELVSAFAYADAEPIRPITKNKVGNKPAITSSSDAHGTWSYSNIAGVYSPIKLLVTQSDGAITHKEYVVNRWSGEYTYSARVWLDQNSSSIYAKIRTAVCGEQFARSPGEDLWRGVSGSSNSWTGWYGDSASDHANPNYFGAPHYLAINRVVIRKVGSEVATVGFAGEATLGGQTDVALGVRLAVLPQQNSTFAAPVFSGEGDVEYQRAATLANVNLMKYASNLSVSNAQVTVSNTGAFPTNAVVDVWKDGIVMVTTAANINSGISGGWHDLNVKKGGSFRTKSKLTGGIERAQLVEVDGGTIWLSHPDTGSADTGNRYIRYITLMNGAETKGYRMRVGNDSNCPPYWHVTGSTPSTNSLQIAMYGLGTARQFTIDVDDVAEGSDFVSNGRIVDGGNSGSTSYEMDIVKAGTGTLEMNNAVQLHSGRALIVESGTFLFGANGGFRSDSASKDVELRGGTLAKASGELACGTLTVGDAGGTLELGRNATMTFSDSSAKTWEGLLTVKGFRDRAIRFGTSDEALTDEQQARIKAAEGYRLLVSSDGYLFRKGLAIVVR